MSEKNLVLSLWPKMLSTNQTSVFFDHQYLWKKSINILHCVKYRNFHTMKLGEIMVFYAVLDFLHGDNHQGKIASQTIC